MDHLNLWYEIFKELDFITKLSIVTTCWSFRNSFYITDLYHIEKKYLELLNDEILHCGLFNQITHLCAEDNSNIGDISFTKNLKVLNANGSCNITQSDIDGLDLVELGASNNTNICNVSFMKSLKILYAEDYSSIDQNGITELDLHVLNANSNTEIIDVSFMKNLKILNAGGACGICQYGIDGLDLYELYIDYNSGITDTSFMKNLKFLSAEPPMVGWED